MSELNLNTRDNAIEWAAEQAGTYEGDAIAPVLADRVATLTAQVEALKAELERLRHSDEEWDLALSEYSEYEGDEAPWHTMRNEFERRDAEIEALKAELEKERARSFEPKSNPVGAMFAMCGHNAYWTTMADTCMACRAAKAEADLEALRKERDGLIETADTLSKLGDWTTLSLTGRAVWHAAVAKITKLKAEKGDDAPQ